MTDYDSQPSHRQQDHHDLSPSHQHQQQQQQQRPNMLERGRSVKLMRNGDLFYPGRSFVINQRKYPMLDVFLDDASQALRANFGAVRCIFTPKNGTRLRDISELEDHQTYVASGGERFKKLHYLDIADGKRISNKDRTLPRLPPVRRFDVEGRALKLARSENVIIYVYRNGDPLTLPAKILLVKSTLQNWESVLDEITRKVALTSSAVLKLYAMNGEQVTSAQQLEYNGLYVAGGKERFKRIEYPDPKSFSPNSSPKMSRKSSNHQFSGYTKSDGSNTHTTTANSHGSYEHAGQRRPVREEYDFFNSKPQQHRRGPTKEIDLDRDDGGVYKGRSNHRERAREVDDTRDTKVEIPIDYREIETVEDENMYDSAGRTPRRNLPPPQQQSQSHAKANSRQRSPPSSPPQHQQQSHAKANSRQRSPPSSPPQHQQQSHAKANSRQRSPPSSPPQHQQQGYAMANSRQRSPPSSPPPVPKMKSPPTKRHDDDDDDQHNNRRFAMNDNHQRQDTSNDHHNTKNNGFDNGYHRRTPPSSRPVDDDENDDQKSQTPPVHNRPQRTSSSTRSNKKDENQAATVIQSHVRGYLTRKHTLQQKEQSIDQLTNNHDQQRPETPKYQRYSAQANESLNSTIEPLANRTVQQAMTEALGRHHDKNDDDDDDDRH